MALEVIYQCDKCGEKHPAESETGKRFLRLRLNVTDKVGSHPFKPQGYGTHDLTFSAIWCPKCLNEHDICYKAHGPDTPKPKTASEKMAAAIADMVEEMVDGGL